MDSIIDRIGLTCAGCASSPPSVAGQMGDHKMAKARKTTIAKPGEFVISQHGAIVGIVLEVDKNKQHGVRYKIGSDDKPFWIFDKELSAPRRGSFDDLVSLYDSLVRLFDRFGGLGGEGGEKVKANIFYFITKAALELSSHKKPNRLVSRRVMLDFGMRAGFDADTMNKGRAIFEPAA
jgi:hypothetical protein